MRGRLLGLITAAGVVTAAVITPTLSQAAGSAGQRIRVFADEQVGFEKFVDVDQSGGPSAGDLDLEQYPIISPDTGERVGTGINDIVVVRLLAKGDLIGLVDGTLILPGGRIMLAGSSRVSAFERGARFAVVGGTGSFRNAQGTALVKNGKLNGHSGQYLTIELS